MLCSCRTPCSSGTLGSIVGNNVGVRFTSEELENYRLNSSGVAINIFTNAKFTLLQPSTSDLAYPSAYYFKAETNAKCYGTGATKQCPGRGMLSQVDMHGNDILNASLVYSEVGIDRAYLFHMHRARILSLHVFDNAGTPTTAAILKRMGRNYWNESCRVGQLLVKILAFFDENQTMVRVKHVMPGESSSAAV